VTDADHKFLATAAAKEALQEFMLLVGVDVSTPAGVIALQDDFRHMREARQAAKEVRSAVRNKVVDVFTGSAVTFVLAAVAYYVTHK
jgi:high-affinity Fe2+/Pb2+ permease